MLLEVLSLILFVCLIVYFVVTIILITKYKSMKKLSRYLIQKYNILNRKSFVLDRSLSLFNLNRVSINEVNESFISLYKDVTDIDTYLNSES